MNDTSYGERDPVAALATPLAESALAVIRTSGEGAIDLLANVFSRPKKIRAAPPNSVVHGWIVEPETSAEKIDEVLISVYRAPKSYTGEDGADICCHGGIATVKAILAALKKAGFRDALPGEFTFRAFMNGKLDLTRAESVMELVSAKTNKGREQAVRRLSGTLETEINAIKNLLTDVLAGTEIYLDYSEDEFTAVNDESSGRLPDRKLAEEAKTRLKTLAELWQRERLYSEGALAVIAGKPNAGKSSLFNYLLREDRSIVTDIPGTTRDWIEALVSVEGIPLRLADTAGLRETGREKNNEAERIGIERSFELLERADIVLYVIDGGKGISGGDREFLLRQKESAPEKPLLVLWNKADLAPPPEASGESELPVPLPLSAKTGEGVSAMLRSVVSLLQNETSGFHNEENFARNAAGPGTLRQKELIDTSLASLEEALALADRHEPLDIIAPLLRDAVNALGEITGEVSNADILDAMFSRFCVGK
jgi:tRNA modification GTPase